jgi:hypothetical protein
VRLGSRPRRARVCSIGELAFRRSALAARLHALAASRRAVGVAEFLAGLRARFADFGASAAGCVMQVRVPQHEILRGVAHLRAVLEETDVMCIGMLAAFFQAVVDRMNGDVVTLAAGIDAFIHFGGLMFVYVWHFASFCSGWFFLTKGLSPTLTLFRVSSGVRMPNSVESAELTRPTPAAIRFVS